MNSVISKATIFFVCLSVATVVWAQTATVAVPGLEAVGRAELVGPHDPAAVLNVDVVLKLRNQAQLRSFLTALQDPSSPEYHQFLTPQQFTERFGPTQAQAGAVMDYLKSEGLTVTGVTPNRLTIHVQATSGDFEQAFGIHINNYRYQGRSVYGSAEAPRLPPALAGEVTTILGLSDIVRPRPLSITSSKSEAESSCGNSPLAIYTPQQMWTAYDWPAIGGATNGAGTTIAIASMDSPDFSLNDPAIFWSHYGLPQHSMSVITVASGNLTNGNVETTLDAEWSGAMAPAANLLIYLGDWGVSGGNLHDVMSQIVTDNQAQVMTVSWGYHESANHALFQEAAAHGMTVVVASGDHGAADPYPSTDPYVVSAGGTSLLLNANNSIQNEVVWNDDWGATGGTVSTLFPEPSWQYGPGVPQNGWRNTNDLSLDADVCTGYHFYYHGFDNPWERFGGGTSYVAPQLAAMFADFISLTNGQTLGQVNPALYADARTHYATDFHDITVGNNNYNGTGGYDAGPGWDHPTGWGSPDIVQLFNHLEGGIALSPPMLLTFFQGCVYNHAHYTVRWHPGQVGTASTYQVEEKFGNGAWQTVYQGSSPGQQTVIPPVGQLYFRARVSNGQFWTRYMQTHFQVPACFGGPPK